MSGNFKTNNVMFPLCCLSFTDIDNLYQKIIYYGIVGYSNHLKVESETIKPTILEFSQSEGEFPDDDELDSIVGYNKDNEDDNYIVLSCIKKDIAIENLYIIKSAYEELNTRIENYEKIHDNDVRCNIHKDMLYDVIHKRIDERRFHIYCAIKAIVGKDTAKCIEKQRIKYAMLGYKSERTYFSEYESDKSEMKRRLLLINEKPELLTDRQITTATDNLHDQKLIAKYTDNRRYIYYSTAYGMRNKDFEEAISSILASKKNKNDERKAQSERITKLIADKAKGY